MCMNLTKLRTLLVDGSITNGFMSPIAEILATEPNVSPFCIEYRKFIYMFTNILKNLKLKLPIRSFRN